jgi:hypothetical protein
MALDADRVTTSLARLRSIQSTVFGAESHGFLLNPPLGEAEVQSFEKTHNIQLPGEYRNFLRTIGNGGAGPACGLFPLGMMDDRFDLQPWHEEEDLVGRISEPFLLENEWNDLRESPEDGSLDPEDPEFETKLEQFDTRYWDSTIVNGAIPICHLGCAIRIWLVVTGNQRGRLWLDGRAEFSGISPVRTEGGTPATFDSWYEGWLDHALGELKVGGVIQRSPNG